MSRLGDRREELAQLRAAQEKAKRETIVRQQLWHEQRTFVDKVVKINVHNVYGDNYRISFYGEKDAGETGFMKIPVLLGSEFINRHVIVPSDDVDELI